uniref:Endonuclease/exonuclease/phosphatase domain-containing protein n=1 Tax=Drosophila pseudoobscura pseudoobscura TaxID=46245 RepID=A0A0R3NVU5_DROPS
MLSVLQLNLHKSKVASAELLIAMEQGLADIALVQEPWIATGNSVAGLKFSNHNLFYSTSHG